MSSFTASLTHSFIQRNFIEPLHMSVSVCGAGKVEMNGLQHHSLEVHTAQRGTQYISQLIQCGEVKGYS